MKIKLITPIILLLTILINTSISNEIIEKIIKKINPLKITVYLNNNKNNIEEKSSILNNIANKFPIITIESNTTFNLTKNSKYLYNDLLAAPLNIILFDNLNDINNLELILNNIKLSYFYLTRSKILLILLNNNFNDIEIKKILLLAWKNNFLDFTILEYKSLNIINYNPFFNKIHYNASLIFSNKLNNVNGYKFNIIVQKATYPNLYLGLDSRNNKLNKIHLNTILYNKNKIITNLLNFTVNYMPLHSFGWDIVNKYDLVLMNMLAIDILHYNQQIINEHSYFLLVVPFKIINELKFNNFKFIIIIFLILLILLLSIYYLNLINIYNLYNIFKLILGFNIDNLNFSSLKSKIIYLTIIFISIFFISDIITKLTELNIDKKEIIDIDDIDDIIKYKYTTCILFPVDHIIRIFLSGNELNNNNNFIKILKQAKLCDQSNINYHRNVLITFSTYFDDNYQQYIQIINNSNSNNFKILNLNLPVLNQVISFKYNSPFVIKYSKIMQRIQESGIEIAWKNQYFDKKEFKNNNLIDDKDGDGNLIKPLLIILFIGYFISTLVLFYEIIKDKKNKCKVHPQV